MKLAKLFGLALVAALTTMALAGAGSAVAKNVSLCEENVALCPEANRYGVGTTIEAQGGEGKLKSETFLGTKEVTCKKSHVKGKITATEQEEQIKGEITSMEWVECSRVKPDQTIIEGCEVKAIQLPWTVHLEQGETQNGNGIMWVGPGNANKEQPGAEVTCPALGTFTFKVKETQPPDQGQEYEAEKWGQFLVTGGEPATITANQIPLKSSNFGVIRGFWEETFTVTSPTKGWVTQH